MRFIRPELKAPTVMVAEDQEEFMTVCAAMVHAPTDRGLVPAHLLCMRFTDEERQAIAEGADLYLSLLTGGGSMQAVMPLVGKEQASAVFNIPVETETKET